MKTNNDLQKQLNECGKMPLFEIEVINKVTKESGFVVCDIEVHQNKLKAFRIALTQKESDSPLIAFDSVDIDSDFSLDWHLQALYDEVINSIVSSDYFELV